MKLQNQLQMEQSRFAFEQKQHQDDLQLQRERFQQQLIVEREKHAAELGHKERLAQIENDAFSDPAAIAARQEHERAMAALKSKQPVPGVDPQHHLQVMQQLATAMHALAAAHGAPRKRTLVRGPDGRATHAIDEVVQGPGRMQ